MKTKEIDYCGLNWYAVYYAKSKVFIRNHNYVGTAKIIYIIW